MIRRLALAASLLVPGILAATPQMSSDPPAAGLSISLRAGIGTHASDLEPRYYDDKFFGALLGGGVGYNTPWEGNAGGATTWEIRYRLPTHWFLGYDASSLVTRPSYSGFYTVNTAGISAGSFESVSLQPLAESTGQFIGGKNVVLSPEWNVDLFGGVRFQTESAKYSITRINQFTSPFSLTQLELSTDATTLGSASGITFGAVFRTNVSKELELSGGIMFYNLLGTARLDYQTIKASSAGGALALRHENGEWRVTGAELLVGGAYTIAPSWRLIARLQSASAMVADSKVINYNFSSDSTFASSNSALGFLLTYPGSSKQESVMRIEAGVEKRFDL